MVNEKHFYKSVLNGYIDHVGYGYGLPEITESEYQQLRQLILNAPEVEEGQEARLREELVWEIHDMTIEQEAIANGSA